MVLVRDRRAEQRHDPVTSELVHSSLEAAHAVGEQREEALHDLAPLVRVDLLRHVHGALDVGEEHSDLLPLAVDLARSRAGFRRLSRRLGEACTARVAERLTYGILRAAPRAWLRPGKAGSAAAAET